MLKREEGHGTSLQVKCKSCIHHSKVPHPEDKKVCESLGITAAAKACSQFNPDFIKLAGVSHDLIKPLGNFMRDCTSEQTQILAFYIRNAEYAKRQKLRLGQQVAFCLSADYLQNYFRGYVLSVSKDGEFVYITSNLNQKEGNTMLTLLRKNVLTVLEFKLKKKKLIKSGRVVEPQGRRGHKTLFDQLSMNKKEFLSYRGTLASKPDDYVPPSIDSVPDTWLDSRQAAKMSEQRKKEIKKQIEKSKPASMEANRKGNKFYVERGTRK